MAQGFCLSQQALRYGPHWRDISDRQAPAGGLDSGMRFSGGITSAAWTGGHPPLWTENVWLGVIALDRFEISRMLVTTAEGLLSTGPSAAARANRTAGLRPPARP